MQSQSVPSVPSMNSETYNLSRLLSICTETQSVDDTERNVSMEKTELIKPERND